MMRKLLLPLVLVGCTSSASTVVTLASMNAQRPFDPVNLDLCVAADTAVCGTDDMGNSHPCPCQGLTITASTLVVTLRESTCAAEGAPECATSEPCHTMAGTTVTLDGQPMMFQGGGMKRTEMIFDGKGVAQTANVCGAIGAFASYMPMGTSTKLSIKDSTQEWKIEINPTDDTIVECTGPKGDCFLNF